MSTEQTPNVTTTPPPAPATPPHSTAIVAPSKREGLDRLRYEPETRVEAFKLAQAIAGTPFCPKGLNDPASVTLVLMLGAELGFTTMQSLRHLYVVNGRPAISTAAKTSLVQQSPECEYLRPIELTSERAVFETKRRGHKDPVKLEWTINDAKAAGLAGKDVWKAYPRKMLAWRCQSDLCDLVYPDLVSGLTTVEEAQDMEPRDVRARFDGPLTLPGDDEGQEFPPEARPPTETRPAATDVQTATPAQNVAPEPPPASKGPSKADVEKLIGAAPHTEVSIAKAREALTAAYRAQMVDLTDLRALFTMLVARARTRAMLNQVSDALPDLKADVPAADLAAMADELETARANLSKSPKGG